MQTKTFGTRNELGVLVPTTIEFEDGSTYQIPQGNTPGGGGNFYSIDVPGKGVVTVLLKDIIIE